MSLRFDPADADFAVRVRASFARQKVMDFIGARMTRVEPGLVEIELPFRPELTQQHGFFHAGITSTIADSAGGYAGFTLFPADSSVLTCWSNDAGFEVVFERQVEALARADDLLVGISTSGRSENLLRAFRKAASLGVDTLAFIPIGEETVPEIFVDDATAVANGRIAGVQPSPHQLGEVVGRQGAA